MIEINSTCPICGKEKTFSAPDDGWGSRDKLTSQECDFGGCITRERALAETIFSLFSAQQVKQMSIHEPAPSDRGLSKWLSINVPKYIKTGYFPTQTFGKEFKNLRNENLELQTFQNEQFDMVIHLDVMEHLFEPFKALNEIYRTLKPNGYCIFSAPTDFGRYRSEQVAKILSDGTVKITGTPEYHGNPQRPEDGALVTWRYGYDFQFLISKMTNFDVEIRRWQSKKRGILGFMTEIYILRK